MKIKLKKKRLYWNVVLGLVWIGIGVMNIVEQDDLRWTNFIFFFLGLFYIGHFLNDYINPYLTIKNGIIKRNFLYGFNNKIDLSAVNEIQKDGKNYRLITASQKMKIKTALIEESSLNELNNFLDNLNLPSEKTPLASTL